MKSPQPAESTAPTNYAPSVPMSVYRELAAELRTNKAVIDSLNSRNQQLTQQNQFLKQEIHNVVQATLNLGQAAGVARQAAQEAGSQGFPNAVAPDTLAKLVRAEAVAQNQVAQHEAHQSPQDLGYEIPDNRQQRQPQRQVAATQPIAQAPAAPPRVPQSPSAAPATTHNRVPRPIEQNPAQAASHTKRKVAKQPGSKQASAKQNRHQTQKQTQKQIKQPANRPPVHPAAFRPTETIPGKGTMVQGAMKPTGAKAGKLFTEQSGEYRSSVLDSQDSKEIGGIWLALSIILIIVTAFGAGFLIMKPLLNDR